MTAISILVVSVIAKNSLGASGEQMDTIATLTALVAGFIVVFNISGKMSAWKWGLLAFIIAIAAGAILLFPGIFDITALSGPMIWLIVITGVIFLAIHTAIFRGILPALERKKEAQSK